MVEAQWMLTEADVKAPRRRRAGVRAVVAAVLANLVIWIIVEVGFGTDLRAPASGGAIEAPDITPSHVVIATLVASLGAWGLLAALERITRRAGAVWLSVSSVALVVTLGGPMSGTGISAGNRVVLLLMHLVVAAVVIPMLARTSTTRPPARATRERQGGAMSVFTEVELAFLLAERRLARLATVGPDGTPHVTPVGWALDATKSVIEVRGRDLAETKKFRDVARTERAAIVIDDVLPPWQPRGIGVRGRAEAIAGPDPVIHIHPSRIVAWGVDDATSRRHAARKVA